MFRARRYRILLIFAAVFVLAVVHFSRSRQPPTVTLGVPPPVDRPDSYPQSPPAADNKGQAPEAPQPTPQPKGLIDSTTSGEKVPSQPDHSDDGLSTPDNTKPSDKPPSKEDGPYFPNNSGSQSQDKLDSDHLEDQQVPHWKKLPERYPVTPADLIKLPTGKSKSLPKLQAKFSDEASEDKMKRLNRLSTIKSTFEHAWNGYKANAMGHDEVLPLRGGFKDTFNGWGATLVDTLDTLWIMGLEEEFSIAVDQVKKIDFTTSKKGEIPVFETAIRYLGGLLGAYDISGHKYDLLLDKAIELAEVLMGAFDTPNRMPMLFYKWKPSDASNPHRASVMSILAELGSLSVEFTRLAQLTRDDKYYDAIARITNELEKFQSQTSIPGLWPMKVDASGCTVSQSRIDYEVPRDLPRNSSAPTVTPTPAESTISYPTDAESYRNLLESRQLHEDAQPAIYDTSPQIPAPKAHDIPTSTGETAGYCKGGLTNAPGSLQFGLAAPGDSTYEYLPKEYMLLGGLNEQYRTMYEKTADAARKHLLFRPMIKDDRDVRFLATVTKPRLDTEFVYTYEGAHLTCFAGGMFAIGSKLFGIESDLKLAAKLTDGCVWAYESTKTGIMPEQFQMIPCKEDKSCVWNEADYWRALDPNAEQRIAQGKQQKELSAKAKDDVREFQNNGTSPTPRSPHDRRDPERGNWHVIASPTHTPTSSGSNDVEGRGPKGPLRDPTPSHEEFALSRIQNEHLPPGVVRINSRVYLLRPEAIESVFIMYRLTGEDYWREKGWKMFQAIAKYTRTEIAHATIKDVTVDEPTKADGMESFWLAETLKYFYLLFSDPTVVDLDEYVLNTEAHPFKRPVY
ncbi:glycosyl hydrolase family 47-domain-containing protein [Aspergillus bertholletiae]|uniref:alpha-1,2-Mannosidase n=1 Tax=Aspergillus bertholletiae TaxID=1226010 RepID=A0A5N7BCY8_9EURO|nr:glycosyl hydrolase family 47-domain-containing protein [Aspergillus bertholletiae]